MLSLDRKRLMGSDQALWRQMLRFFLPFLFGTFFQQLYSTVDTLIVGNFLGKTALAAVGGTCGTLVNLTVGFFAGMAGGATVIIAQGVGAGDRQSVHRAVHTGMALALCAGAFLSLLGLTMSETALRWMGTPADVLPLSKIYISTYSLGMIPNLVYNIGAGILQAVGDSRRPLIFLIIACCVNTVLDLLLVAALPLGVLGAALATILSQTMAAALVLRVLIRTREIHRLELRKIRFHGPTLKRVIRIGIPAGFQSSMYAISNVLIQSCVNSFGTDVMAAHTAFVRIDALNWLASGAFGTTVATFAGQSYGAGNMKRMRSVVHIGLVMNGIFALFFTLFMQFGGVYMLRLFLKEPETIRLGMQMIRMISIGYLLFVPCEIFSAACRSAGNTLRPMIMTASGVCVFRVLWIFTAVKLWHRTQVLFACFPISWLITGGMFTLYYLRGKWAKGLQEADP